MFSIKHIDVFQDGADFYQELADSTPKLATAPFRVKDGDMDAAARARAWFRRWCQERNMIARFEWEA